MKNREVIPRPRSKYLRVKCGGCGNEQILFDRVSSVVKCQICDEVIGEPTGGKTRITGEVLQELH